MLPVHQSLYAHLHSKDISFLLSVPLFSRLVTVEAATCVRPDMADIMICWQKHKKMMWSGWRWETLAQSEPGTLSPTSPRGIHWQGIHHLGVCIPFSIFLKLQLSPSFRKCTLPNLRAATSTGKHTEHYLKVWRQARKGLSKASNRGLK